MATPAREGASYDRRVPGRLARLPVPVWAQDVLLAAVVVALQVEGTVSRTEVEPTAVLRPLDDLGGLGFVLLAASGTVLAVRRRWPVAVFLVAAGASLAYYGLDFPDGPGWLGLFVATYTMTARGDGRRSVALAAVVIGVLGVTWLVAGADVEPRAAVGWVFFRIGATAMCAALGESVRSRRVIATEALERAELAERTREEEARARVVEERLRIAREVHDTVAHAIAIINVQAGTTAHVLDKRPDRARSALETIERTSSRALDEMRAILGVLRDDVRVPGPGIEDLDGLDGLVDHARQAGLEVTLERPSAPVQLPSAVAGAVYRIVQEGLTNVIRHVGPTAVRVELSCGAEELHLRVHDAGRTSARPRSRQEDGSPGHGLIGMRERCALLGGELVAGPVPGGGFEVTARLPLLTDVAVRS